MECVVKSLHDVKVIGSKLVGTKIQPNDFDGLNTLESQFLNHTLVSQVTNTLTNIFFLLK